MSPPTPLRDAGPRGDLLRRLGLAIIELAGIFVTDLLLPKSVALGAFYAVPLLFCFHVARRREVLALAAAATVLAPVGAFFGSDGWAGLELRVVVPATTGVFAIWLTARLLLIRIGDEERLFATRELNEIALGATADGVLVTDAAGVVSWVNRAAETMLGWRLSEAKGRSLSSVYRPVDDTAAREEDLPQGLVIVRTRSGARLPVEVTEGGIRDLRGEPLGRVLVLRDASQRAALEQELREMAFRDRLTGLPNRALLFERLELELAHAVRDRGRVGLLFIDLDRFKEVNDTLGHQAGDDLLRGVAARLSSLVRATDTVARLAGDEFVILLTGLHVPRDARLVAEKICSALAAPFRLGDHERTVLPSVGVALYPDDGATSVELLERADGAMYAAKNAGGGRFAFATEPSADAAAAGEGDAVAGEAAGDDAEPPRG